MAIRHLISNLHPHRPLGQRPYQRLQRFFGSITRVIRVKECIQSARLIARYEAPVGADDAAIEIVSDRQ
jgi:hypothetical protein